MHLAPIALFVYNRPDHTEKTIEALKKNYYASESELFIFSDGPKKDKDIPLLSKVREISKNVTGFKNVRVIEQDKNMGLANSIIFGVTKLCKEFGSVIVLEDDLITSPFFLKFMNEGLIYYKNYKNVFTICGFNHPPKLMKIPRNYRNDVYFTYRNNSTGWGTWGDRWNMADWEINDFKEFSSDKKEQRKFNQSGEDLTDMLIAQMQGKIDSWSIRWTYAHFRHSAFAVYPVKSYIDNIGFDGSGIHSKNETKYKNVLDNSKVDTKFIPPFLDENILKQFKKIYKSGLRSKMRKYFQLKFI